MTKFFSWLHHHARRFVELPKVTVPSAAVTDDECEIWGDHRYLSELVTAILDQAHDTESATACRQLTSILARPTIDDQDVDRLDWVRDLAVLSNTRHEIEAWRDELERTERAHNWWLAECEREARELVV